MPGTLHIMLLDQERGSYDKPVRYYQANYTTPGNTYARSYDEEKLTEFLRTKVALTGPQVERVLEDLRSTGHTTVGEVEISPAEASAMGLEQVPSDF